MLSYDFHLTIREIKVVCSLEFISVVNVFSSQTENSSIIWTWGWNSSDLKNLILQNHLSVCFTTDEATRLFITYINLCISMCSWIYLQTPMQPCINDVYQNIPKRVGKARYFPCIFLSTLPCTSGKKLRKH